MSGPDQLHGDGTLPSFVPACRSRLVSGNVLIVFIFIFFLKNPKDKVIVQSGTYFPLVQEVFIMFISKHKILQMGHLSMP